MSNAQITAAVPRRRRAPFYAVKSTALRRASPVLAVFVCIVGLQLLVTVLSIDVMASVRAYVSGESLYSKGQKDAQFYLISYSESRNERDFDRFMTSLAVPLGDRSAREEMEKTVFDSDVARRSYLQGGNHPADITGAIRLFRWLHKTPLMSDAIETWTKGDELVDQLRRLGIQAHDRIAAGDLRAPEVTGLRSRVMLINEQLTPLEARFASQLSDAARQSEQALFWFNATMALLLALSGSAFVTRSVRMQLAAEGEVRLRRESLQGILDSAAEGLFGVDSDGNCTFINRSALRMLGYKRESEVLGREMWQLIHHSTAAGITISREDSCIARGARESREFHLTEAFWRHDGTSFPAEYWSHPRLEEGRFAGAVVTFFDVSQQIKMQEALRRGEVRIAGLVDAVNDGVLALGADKRILLFNRAAERLFGVSAKEAIGSEIGRFLPQMLGTAGGARLAVVDGRVRELMGRRFDGREFPLEASLSSMDTDGGTLITVVMRDVTELKLARAELQAIDALRASNKAKSDFLSRMSHELRTPLNAVLGFAQLIRLDKRKPPAPEHAEQLRLIENAGSHLLALVNDVLDLSRVDSGQMPVTMEPVNLRAAIEDALSMVVPLARSNGIKTWVAGHAGDLVTRGLDDGGVSEVAVLADLLRLRQILVNLLSNAIKYNRPGGEIRISWQVSDVRCTISIEDDGAGIPPEKLERLFEPFNRLGAENSKVEGTGIGLVLSRRLADLMGGTLEITSRVDVGTNAVLTLARSEVADEQEPGTPPSQHGALDRTQHVLYAEDNEVNIAIVRQVMTFRPAIVFDTAESGAEAFRKARQTRPDLLLVDMNLGDMTGLELAKALQEDPSTAGIRLVALSADALPEQINAAMDAGFDDYLTKPVNFRELLNVVDGKRDRRSSN